MWRQFLLPVAVRTVVLTAAFSFGVGPCFGAEPQVVASSATAFRGVVVLRDGGVLSGEIVRAGERYLVSTLDSEINVGVSNVVMVCGTLEEAYEHRREAIRSPTVEAHLDLADWCLRQKLMAQAERELTDARARDARHPKLALLERRLEVAREPRTDPAVVKRANVEVVEPADKQSRQPVRDAARLRVLASDLPDGAVERFTRKVQPLLVNSCATAGCHQIDGPHEFQLDRSLLHGMANRRSTTHNLRATLALVNRDQPERSPLLTVPRRPHGDMEEAVFGAHDAKLVQQLTEWIALVTYDEQKAAAEAAAAEAARKKAAMSAIGIQDIESEFGISQDGVTQAHLLTPAKRVIRQPANSGAAAIEQAVSPDADAANAIFEEVTTLRPAPRLRYGAQLQHVGPRDEFDPEIFNRRYGNSSTGAQ